jgi:hypothetical protein
MNNRYESQFNSDNQWTKKKSVQANTCTCTGKKKITIALYGGEAHVMGSPTNVEVTVLNLDKVNRQMNMLLEDSDEDLD